MQDVLHRLPEFVGNHLMLAMMFVVILLALVGGEVSRLFRGYKELTPNGLTQLINRDNALLVDLSANQDFERGHIAGAKHVPLSQFDPEHKDLGKGLYQLPPLDPRYKARMRFSDGEYSQA